MADDRPTPGERPLPHPAEMMLAASRRSTFTNLRARIAVRSWLLKLALRAAARRTVDIAGGAAGLVALSPVFVVTALAIRLDSPGPVFFRQTRVGKRGRLFTMYKFRSMRTTAEVEKQTLDADNESRDGVLFKMRRDPRVTRVGRIIRRLSIDELPQLINIVRGDMSIVGPRPALPSEVEQYDFEARKRLQARPGLTCLWQIGGRSELAFSEQIDLDLRYLQSRSLKADIGIIARTVPVVITGKGAY